MKDKISPDSTPPLPSSSTYTIPVRFLKEIGKATTKGTMSPLDQFTSPGDNQEETITKSPNQGPVNGIERQSIDGREAKVPGSLNQSVVDLHVKVNQAKQAEQAEQRIRNGDAVDATTMVNDKPPITADTEGYRYLVFFEPKSKVNAAADLGSYPTLGEVVNYVVKRRLPEKLQLPLKTAKGDSGRIHLVDDEQGRLTLLDLARGDLGAYELSLIANYKYAKKSYVIL